MAGAAVLAAVVGGAAFALTSGGHGTSGPAGGTPPAGTGNVAGKPVAQWQALSAEHGVLATWSYGHSLVVAANTQVTAYDQATGKVIWQTEAPVVQRYNTMFCGASPSASAALTVVGLGVVTDSTGLDSDCHSITSLNLATGKLGWLDSLPSGPEQATYAQSLDGAAGLVHHGLVAEVSGNTVVAGWLGVLGGFSLATGDREWLNVLGGESGFDGYVAKDIAIAGASTYVAVEQVEPVSMQLLSIDTASGKVARKAGVAKSMTGLASPLEATILSTAPLTVAFGQVLPSPSTTIVAFTASLTAAWVRPAEPQHPGDVGLFAVPALGGNDEAHQFFPFALGNGLFAAVGTASGDGTDTLTAFSAATGARKWTATVPGTDFWMPVTVTGPVIQAVGISQAGRGKPVLISIDAATGKVLATGQPRVLGPAPLGQANAFYRYVTAGGHVYGVNWGEVKASKGSVPAVFSLG